jgi:hypothetical protein
VLVSTASSAHNNHPFPWLADKGNGSGLECASKAMSEVQKADNWSQLSSQAECSWYRELCKNDEPPLWVFRGRMKEDGQALSCACSLLAVCIIGLQYQMGPHHDKRRCYKPRTCIMAYWMAITNASSPRHWSGLPSILASLSWSRSCCLFPIHSWP